MKKQTFIGIDISKKTLDLAIRKDDQMTNLVIANEPKAIRKTLRAYRSDELVIGMENTGRYNQPLYEVLANWESKVFIIPPIHLKKSIGLTRGKNDKIDAERILWFTEKNWKELPQWKPTPKQLQRLKVLLSERSARVKMIRQMKSTQKEYSMIAAIDKEEKLTQMNLQLIKTLEKQVAEIEGKIERLIASQQELSSQAEMIRSVPGVGAILCWNLIAKTDNFQSISDPRKMACYCGVVPFEHQSGTSVRRKKRVSLYADKSLKSLLHLAAMSAIRLDNDLRDYYLRKVEEGKNKMSVLNAVRNKIIHRVFAVVKNQSPYIDYSVAA